MSILKSIYGYIAAFGALVITILYGLLKSSRKQLKKFKAEVDDLNFINDAREKQEAARLDILRNEAGLIKDEVEKIKTSKKSKRDRLNSL